jgi:hypothetical protein
MPRIFILILILTSVTLTPAANFALAQAPAAAPTATPHASLQNPLETENLNEFIGRIIKAALGLAGSLALLMFVWGGMQWLISGGSAERIKKGKDTLIWAVLGIVVIFTAYTLVNVLVKALASGQVG